VQSSRFGQLDAQGQKDHVLDLARTVLLEYPFEVESIELINYQFNATFKVVTTKKEIFALRINVNSDRTYENLRGELAFVSFLNEKQAVNLPKPVACKKGEFALTVASSMLERDLGVVLYSWLEGEELGDEPSDEALRKLGAAMAAMHQATADFTLPDKAQLPFLKDFLWQTQDIIFSSASPLSKEDIELLTKAKNEIENIIEDLYSGSKSIAIHADLHGANVFTHRDQIYIFDFDDAGFGLPIQDLAIALYYLDTPEQEAALLAGYQSVSELPRYDKHQLIGLLLQRRIILLNYLYETTNQEHRDMAPEYLVETLRRVRFFLDQK
jgi:Ser/Thr protein kinase RdoA (MazF antagonist)